MDPRKLAKGRGLAYVSRVDREEDLFKSIEFDQVTLPMDPKVIARMRHKLSKNKNTPTESRGSIL